MPWSTKPEYFNKMKIDLNKKENKKGLISILICTLKFLLWNIINELLKVVKKENDRFLC